MKILFINNEMAVGGVTKCILNLTKNLKDEFEIVIASNGGELTHEFIKLGVKLYNINDVDNKNPFNIMKNIKIIKEIIKEEKIDIVHSHHRMTTLLSKMAAKFVKVKVIHTQHLCINDKFILTNFTLNNIPTIAVSKGAKQSLVEKAKLDEKDIVTIYNGVDDKYQPIGIDSRIEKIYKKGDFLVAQISRIVDYKGVYDFVDIAEAVSKENKNIKFILIGHGEEYYNIEKYIKNKKMEENVILLGNKNNILEYINYIDIMLLCSYIEGLPLAPIESFSQSIPVIGTNISGTNEEIIHEYNGYLVECKDVNSFKKYILKLYNNNQLKDSMAKNAYDSYCENFNMMKYIDSHRTYYNKIISQVMNKY